LRGEPSGKEDDTTDDVDDDVGAPPLDDLFDNFFCCVDQEVGEIPENDVEEAGCAGAASSAGGSRGTGVI
jgi:hypothetical protein